MQQVFRLERQVTIHKTGQLRHEVVYGITSLSAEQAAPDHLLEMLLLTGRLKTACITDAMSPYTKMLLVL